MRYGETHPTTVVGAQWEFLTLFTGVNALVYMAQLLLSFLSSLFILGCDNGIEEYDPERAAKVIGQKDVPVLQQPGRHSLVNTHLEPGAVIKVMAKFRMDAGNRGESKTETWYRIRIDSSSTGWCQAEHIQLTDNR